MYIFSHNICIYVHIYLFIYIYIYILGASAMFCPVSREVSYYHSEDNGRSRAGAMSSYKWGELTRLLFALNHQVYMKHIYHTYIWYWLQWFQTWILFSIIYGIIMDNPSHWLIFFKMVKATNQDMWVVRSELFFLLSVGGYTWFWAIVGPFDVERHASQQEGSRRAEMVLTLIQGDKFPLAACKHRCGKETPFVHLCSEGENPMALPHLEAFFRTTRGWNWALLSFPLRNPAAEVVR